PFPAHAVIETTHEARNIDRRMLPGRTGNVLWGRRGRSSHRGKRDLLERRIRGEDGPLVGDRFVEDTARLEAEREAEGGADVDPEVVLIGGIDEAAFGGKQFDGLMLGTDELVLDLLKFAPVFLAAAIVALDVEIDERRHVVNLDVIGVVFE